MTGSAISFIRGFARESAGSAGIEVGLGSVALLTVSMLCFDIYSVIRLDTAGARSAIAVADYVSREIAPNGDEIAALGEFLHRTEFDAPANVAYVISAVRRPTGDDPAAVLWADNTIRFGNEAATAELAGECTLRASQGWRPVLLGPPATSGMQEGEVTFVAEVCSRPSQQGLLTNTLIAGDSYHVHILPARNSNEIPAEPVYAAEGGSR